MTTATSRTPAAVYLQPPSISPPDNVPNYQLIFSQIALAKKIIHCSPLSTQIPTTAIIIRLWAWREMPFGFYKKRIQQIMNDLALDAKQFSIPNNDNEIFYQTIQKCKAVLKSIIDQLDSNLTPATPGCVDNNSHIDSLLTMSKEVLLKSTVSRQNSLIPNIIQLELFRMTPYITPPPNLQKFLEEQLQKPSSNSGNNHQPLRQLIAGYTTLLDSIIDDLLNPALINSLIARTKEVLTSSPTKASHSDLIALIVNLYSWREKPYKEYKMCIPRIEKKLTDVKEHSKVPTQEQTPPFHETVKEYITLLQSLLPPPPPVKSEDPLPLQDTSEKLSFKELFEPTEYDNYDALPSGDPSDIWNEIGNDSLDTKPNTIYSAEYDLSDL